PPEQGPAWLGVPQLAPPCTQFFMKLLVSQTPVLGGGVISPELPPIMLGGGMEGAPPVPLVPSNSPDPLGGAFDPPVPLAAAPVPLVPDVLAPVPAFGVVVVLLPAAPVAVPVPVPDAPVVVAAGV